MLEPLQRDPERPHEISTKQVWNSAILSLQVCVLWMAELGRGDLVPKPCGAQKIMSELQMPDSELWEFIYTTNLRDGGCLSFIAPLSWFFPFGIRIM